MDQCGVEDTVFCEGEVDMWTLQHYNNIKYATGIQLYCKVCAHKLSLEVYDHDLCEPDKMIRRHTRQHSLVYCCDLRLKSSETERKSNILQRINTFLII